MIIATAPSKMAVSSPHAPRRLISDALAPLEKIAIQSSNLIIARDVSFKSGDRTYELPRYIFVGPQGGNAPIHVGIFAAIRGDEPEGTRAIIQIIKMLEATPELATGYCLTFYPVCNPTGFEDNTRFSRNGKDLDREFWKNSSEPEVQLLQAELLSRSFQGIISLRADDTNVGYGYSRGTTLTKHLLKSAANCDRVEGALSVPPKVRPRPFEISLRCPAHLPSYLKEMSFIASFQMILTEYRELIAYAPNL